jgi:hypothetical protein
MPRRAPRKHPAAPKPGTPARPVHAPVAPASPPVAPAPLADTGSPTQTLFLLVVLLCVGLSARPVTPAVDTWAHAAVGKWIWDNGRVPDRTLYLWSADQPWVAHSWLAQLAFYGLVSAGGDEPDGPLRLVTMAACALTFGLIWRMWARHAPTAVWAALVFAFVIQYAAPRFRPRPELFTALGVTVLLLYLHHRTAAPPVAGWRKRELVGGAALAAMFVVWTNAHGGVAVGLALLATTAACDLAQDRFDRRSRALALLAVGCAAATLLNPYGLAYWNVLRTTGGYTFAHIVEWLPPWTAPAAGAGWYVRFVLLVAVAVTGWARGPRRRWAELAWVVGTACATLSARRHVYLLCLVSLIVAAAHADALAPRAPGGALGRLFRRGRPARPGADALSAAPAPGGWRGPMLVGAVVGGLLLASWISPDWVAPPPPDGAADFLREHHTGGRVFNLYDGSSYLQWRLVGHPPLFIDLLNAYPDRVMIDHDDIVGCSPRGRALLDELRIDWVVFTADLSVPMTNRPLYHFLTRHPGWRVVYRDDAAVVWARRTAATDALPSVPAE